MIHDFMREHVLLLNHTRSQEGFEGGRRGGVQLNPPFLSGSRKIEICQSCGKIKIALTEMLAINGRPGPIDAVLEINLN